MAESESRPDGGTTLEVQTLDAQEPDPESVEGEAMGRLCQKCVLVVDDNRVVREALRSLLHSQGYQCELAEHGSDALSRLSAGGIDLVITDHDMPVMDGLRLLGEVSKNLHLNIPVIMVTGSLNERLRKRVLAAGAYAVLSKPCSYSMLMSTVKEALKTPSRSK